MEGGPTRGGLFGGGLFVGRTICSYPEKGSTPRFLGCSCQLLLNIFFNPSPPSMRKIDDGEKKKKEKKKIMLYIVATNVVASRPP